MHLNKKLGLQIAVIIEKDTAGAVQCYPPALLERVFFILLARTFRILLERRQTKLI